jgi:hypothetical protein
MNADRLPNTTDADSASSLLNRYPNSVAFVHDFLDAYGLDPYEFRIYCHIVRRTGGET